MSPDDEIYIYISDHTDDGREQICRNCLDARPCGSFFGLILCDQCVQDCVIMLYTSDGDE